MIKNKENFDNWNKQKQFIEEFWKIKRVKSWEIWTAKLGINIWSEISKDWDFLRPVLVFKNYMWGDLVAIIPITTKFKDKYSDFLFEIKNYKKYGLAKNSYLSLNNFKTISCKRLVYKINDKKVDWKYKYLVKKSYLKLIKKKLKKVFEL